MVKYACVTDIMDIMVKYACVTDIARYRHRYRPPISHPARATIYETMAKVYQETGRKAQADRTRQTAQRLARHGL